MTTEVHSQLEPLQQSASQSYVLLRALTMPETGLKAAALPAYQLARLSALARDYSSILKLLARAGEDREAVVAMKLMLRHTMAELAWHVRRTLDPLEHLIQRVEAALKGAGQRPPLTVHDPAQLLTSERDELEERLRTQFRALKVTEPVLQPLARGLAETDRLCRVLADRIQVVAEVSDEGVERLDPLLTRLLEIQLLLDVELRAQLLEEHPADETPCFEVGLWPWTSMFLAEVGRHLAEPPGE